MQFIVDFFIKGDRTFDIASRECLQNLIIIIDKFKDEKLSLDKLEFRDS